MWAVNCGQKGMSTAGKKLNAEKGRGYSIFGFYVDCIKTPLDLKPATCRSYTKIQFGYGLLPLFIHGGGWEYFQQEA